MGKSLLNKSIIRNDSIDQESNVYKSTSSFDSKSKLKNDGFTSENPLPELLSANYSDINVNSAIFMDRLK